jgi:hypothetical protein
MRRVAALPCSFALLLATAALAPAAAWGQEGSPACAETTAAGHASPEPGHPCWVDMKPYPFGSFAGPSGIEEAGPVETERPQWVGEHPQCVRGGIEPGTAGTAAIQDECYLTVTSMAFRSWNHGLAATYPASLPVTGSQKTAQKNPYAVWIFNGNLTPGQQWYPDPTFPGRKICPGHTIVWAGKLDYWLVGVEPEQNNGWARLCRYDGLEHEWQPFSVPKAALQRVTRPTIPGGPLVGPKEQPKPQPGGITSAACIAWNDCWFFGSYGVVLHWNGQTLADASPAPADRWLRGEYLAAVTSPASEDPVGSPFAAVVGGTAESFSLARESELIPPHGGSAPPELFRSINGGFSMGSLGGASSALAFVAPTHAQEHDAGSGWHDPYRTDLVAVGFDATGQGWVAGNPAGLRSYKQMGCAPICTAPNRGFEAPEAPQPAPLIPISATGGRATCTTPSEAPFPPEELSYTPSLAQTGPAGAFLWSSIAVVPGSGEGLAGGSVRPQAGGGSGTNETVAGEPVIVSAGCDGHTTTTRFRITEEAVPGQPEHTAADRDGTVTAIVANAANDAWAASSEGTVIGEKKPPLWPDGEPQHQPPHLYYFTNGGEPEAPEGNDVETRAVELEENPPFFVLEAAPEQPALPAPPLISAPQTINLPAAIYGVKTQLRPNGKEFNLYLSFKLRRPVTLGAQGLRHGRVVSSARPRHFTGHKGVLVLRLNREHWPTKVRFVS